jgi:ribonuclease H-related protein
MTKYRDEVEFTTRQFGEFLAEKKKIVSELDPGSFRDYSVSVDISSWNLRYTVWYSPKRQSSKITVIRSQDPANVEKLHMAWHEFQQGKILDNGDIHAFVDGSYIKGTVGYGLVIIKKGLVLTEIKGTVDRPEYRQHHQVGGELVAAVKFFQWCIDNTISRCTIHYDYEGIQKWATGSWKAKKELTRKYQEYVQKLPLDITWIKVKSHSGNLWNERADRLAKEAIKG